MSLKDVELKPADRQRIEEFKDKVREKRAARDSESTLAKG